MQQKKSILIRTYLVFIALGVFCACIVGRAIYIQQVEGAYYKNLSDSTHIRYEAIEAERGTIYSEDGQVLSTSVPEFDVYVDFMAEGLRNHNGLLFKTYVDSLAINLAGLFRDQSIAAYKAELKSGYRKKDRYALLKRKVSFKDYEALFNMPLIKMGRNKSGFIAVARTKRLYPFRNLANRTIGIAREQNNVGLERQYNSYLSGISGKRLVRTISGGAKVPIEGSDDDPKDGADIITTLDVTIQDAAQEALRKMMVFKEALWGTCIVMEVSTGKIRAMANLGRLANGNYAENLNYALSATEPGSTWKLVSLLSVLDDKQVDLNSMVDLEGGRWSVAGRTVMDSEEHGLYMATVLQAFEKSSNVGMAKLVYNAYYNQPSKFIRHIAALGLDTLTGIDLPGESKPDIHKPGSRRWSNTTLPWMGFGYNLTITPLHTATLYNAVANGGKMMKPYLVNAILKDGIHIKDFYPTVIRDSICTRETLLQLRQSLEGVVTDGTARKLKSDNYAIAGKTGTSLVADKGITYKDHMFQSSFAGYFPANDPQFTIVVVIRNRQGILNYYGADVAGPVFREVSDRLFAFCRHDIKAATPAFSTRPEGQKTYNGKLASLKQVVNELGIQVKDSSRSGESAGSISFGSQNLLTSNKINGNQMPALDGIGLKDALDICENRGLKVTVSGRGKVHQQSIGAGENIRKGQLIHLELN